MGCGIKRRICNYTCNSKLNRKVVKIKRCFEEIDELLKKPDQCRRKR